MEEQDYRIVPEVGGFYVCGMDESVREVLETREVNGTWYVLIQEPDTGDTAHWQDANFIWETATWSYCPASHREHLVEQFGQYYPSLKK